MTRGTVLRLSQIIGLENLMLAINSLITNSCRTLGLAAIVVSSAFTAVTNGQQTPAQRYEPVRSNVYETQTTDSDYYPERVHREGVRQTSYQQAAEPAVPAILAGAKGSTSNALRKAAQSSAFSLPTPAIGANSHTMPPKSPADFAGQMGIRTKPIDSNAFGRAAASPVTSEAKSATIPVAVIPQNNTLPTPRNTVQPPAPSTVQPAPTVQSVPTVQQVAATAAAGRSSLQAESIRSSVSGQRTNDLRGTAVQVAREVQPTVGRIAAPQQFTPVASQAATTEPQEKEMVHDRRVLPTAAAVPVAENTSMKIAAPAIEVVAVGPQTISINKSSEYKVVVRNNSSIRAERILVGINIPTWVDIENVSLTAGGREITDGQGQARLVWSVDQIPGNSSQTMTIAAIPRKAQIFDMDVEWTLVPLVGKTSIRVTEPKLEMAISGPKEVQYGETALYHVSIRNPGTGAAENVSIMLPEALGGERATLGVIPPGKEKHLQVELLALTAGDLSLLTTAAGEGNLKATAETTLVVRRASLAISMNGPGLKYAGGIGKYSVTLTNTGDATATELEAAVVLPSGVKYLKGIDAVKLVDSGRGMRWPVGSLAPSESRTYEMFCQLDTSGDLKLEVGARGKRGLAASSEFRTTVETIADLVLSVNDLKGPLPTGEEVPYTIKIRNRGTKAAKGVNLVMQFSEGIEPRSAKGLEYQIAPGEVLFSPIAQINPGQEMTFEVNAEAYKSGTFIFRALLTCDESDTREVAEGTTRYFGDPVDPPKELSNAPAASTAELNDNSFIK